MEHNRTRITTQVAFRLLVGGLLALSITGCSSASPQTATSSANTGAASILPSSVATLPDGIYESNTALARVSNSSISLQLGCSNGGSVNGPITLAADGTFSATGNLTQSSAVHACSVDQNGVMTCRTPTVTPANFNGQLLTSSDGLTTTLNISAMDGQGNVLGSYSVVLNAGNYSLGVCPL